MLLFSIFIFLFRAHFASIFIRLRTNHFSVSRAGVQCTLMRSQLLTITCVLDAQITTNTIKIRFDNIPSFIDFIQFRTWQRQLHFFFWFFVWNFRLNWSHAGTVRYNYIRIFNSSVSYTHVLTPDNHKLSRFLPVAYRSGTRTANRSHHLKQ